ncbi:hypothetical protein SISSUDRAFT_1041189 [Sistotremastrum suecicum HHB10207 ss-3]|uniref:Uncharacterized protein n=1 Tax=Sistotremastrum suecicum HHB10207 ss-3 TaxID=1314776 RepID=A0A166HD50_9AGAM|nr:hypothetical protein SISSUDRAFT_1041189 [Sistotremastrum suecicum HHB10207 ss-3]
MDKRNEEERKRKQEESEGVDGFRQAVAARTKRVLEEEVKAELASAPPIKSEKSVTRAPTKPKIGKKGALKGVVVKKKPTTSAPQTESSQEKGPDTENQAKRPRLDGAEPT